MEFAPEPVRYAKDSGVLVNREAQRRGAYMLNRYFPDCTPTCRKLRGGFISRNKLHHRDAAGHQLYCRVLYPKHVALMNAGAVHRERAIIAGNRCLTPWTPIETDRGERLIGEMIGEEAFSVPSWDGATRCSRRAGGVFLKGFEPAYRVLLDNGQYFDVTGRHRVLTPSGWIEFGQLIQISSGWRCRQTGGDSLSNCGRGDSRDGVRPPVALDIGPGQPPSRAGAPELPHLSRWPADAEAPISRCSRASEADVLLSTICVRDQLAALCEQFPDPGVSLDAQWSLRARRDVQRQLVALGPRREDLECASPAPYWRALGVDQGPCGVAGMPSTQKTEDQDPGLSVAWCPRGSLDVRSLEIAPHSEMFVPWFHPSLAGPGGLQGHGERIALVVPLGCQPIVDYTVEETHNYFAGGVVHHNTGKTQTGTFEVTCHATGLYPHWWRGRRFDEPTSIWAAGDTGKTVRNILQRALLGPASAVGTGFIPAHLIVAKTKKSGIADAYEMLWVRHVPTGKVSTIELKSYDQRREAYQGTAQHVILYDEEPPMDIYAEGLLRTTKTSDFPGGMILLTFTPLQGRTVLVKQFLSDAVRLDAEGGDR